MKKKMKTKNPNCKEIISRLGKNENDCEMFKNEKKKARAKRAKYCFSLLNMQIICDFPVAILVVSS